GLPARTYAATPSDRRAGRVNPGAETSSSPRRRWSNVVERLRPVLLDGPRVLTSRHSIQRQVRLPIACEVGAGTVLLRTCLFRRSAVLPQLCQVKLKLVVESTDFREHRPVERNAQDYLLTVPTTGRAEVSFVLPPLAPRGVVETCRTSGEVDNRGRVNQSRPIVPFHQEVLARRVRRDQNRRTHPLRVVQASENDSPASPVGVDLTDYSGELRVPLPSLVRSDSDPVLNLDAELDTLLVEFATGVVGGEVAGERNPVVLSGHLDFELRSGVAFNQLNFLRSGRGQCLVTARPSHEAGHVSQRVVVQPVVVPVDQELVC